MITDEFSRRTLAKMELALENACSSLPVGEDHAARQQIAAKLIECANKGGVSQLTLMETGLAAATDLSKRLSTAR
jgi:hypothetical protein